MKSRKFLRWGYNTLVVVLLLAGIYFVVAHFVHFGNSEITDNATIYRHITPVNTRVQGFIREIRFDDYQKSTRATRSLSSMTANFAYAWRRLKPIWQAPPLEAA